MSLYHRTTELELYRNTIQPIIKYYPISEHYGTGTNTTQTKKRWRRRRRKKKKKEERRKKKKKEENSRRFF